MDILEHLVRSAPARDPIPSLAAFSAFIDERSPSAATLDRAVWAGFASDRLAYAFAGGYLAALEQLLAIHHAGAPRHLALAATEAGGAHPRAIATTLEPTPRDPCELVLRGEKTFVTLASVAEGLLVVADDLRPSTERTEGQKSLVVVQVSARAPGVTIVDREPTAFAPEIPHGKVTLDGVVVRGEDILPGDGYAGYVKPFRTIEDLHVLAASLGLFVRIARLHRFVPTATEQALGIIAGLRELAGRGPSEPATHLALAGLIHALRRLLADADPEWEKVDGPTRDRWRRDLGLFLVAENARTRRTEAAWKRTATIG